MSNPSRFIEERRKVIDRLRDEGRFEEAIEVCGEMIAADEENYTAYSERAEILYSAGRREEAFRDLEILMRLRPGSPSAYYIRAKWNLEDGNYRSVVDDAAVIIQSRDKYFVDVAYFFRSLANFNLGNKKDAISDCLRLPEEFKMSIDMPGMGWKVLSRKDLHKIVAG